MASWLVWAAVVVLGLLLPRAAALAPRQVESLYTRGIFRTIASALGWMSGLVRFDLAQIVIAAAAAAILSWLVRSVIRTWRHRSPRKGFGPGHRILAVVAACIWGFYLLWGLNYAQPPLGPRMHLARVEPDTARLSRVARLLGAEVNRSYRQALRGRQVEPVHPRAPVEDAAPARAGSRSEAHSALLLDKNEISRRLASAYASIEPRIGLLPCSNPKTPAAAGWVLTRTGISGFYFPLTGEATVNREMPDASLPFTMAHEMAHQRGTAREDEANFLAYLACRESGLAAARYSGALGAFGLVLADLAEASIDSARAVRSTLGAGPRADRAAIRSFWTRHEGRASVVAEKVNDRYLKANAQPAGIETYGQAVELLIAYLDPGETDSGVRGSVAPGHPPEGE